MGGREREMRREIRERGVKGRVGIAEVRGKEGKRKREKEGERGRERKRKREREGERGRERGREREREEEKEGERGRERKRKREREEEKEHERGEREKIRERLTSIIWAIIRNTVRRILLHFHMSSWRRHVIQRSQGVHYP